MPEVNDVLNDRQDEYGDAHANFTKIGKIWGALLDIDPIESYQVALMMDALKTVRVFRNAQHKDSWVDKQGYTHLAQEIIFYEP